MHVCAAGAKTGRLGAQLASRYIQARMTECSKYICIWALFFDLYRIITYLPQPPSTLSLPPTLPSPLPPLLAACTLLARFSHPRPLPDFIRALYPFQPSREKSECKSPICTHYTERVLGMRTTRAKRQREDVRKASKTHAALNPVTSRFSFDIES